MSVSVANDRDSRKNRNSNAPVGARVPEFGVKWVRVKEIGAADPERMALMELNEGFLAWIESLAVHQLAYNVIAPWP